MDILRFCQKVTASAYGAFFLFGGEVQAVTLQYVFGIQAEILAVVTAALDMDGYAFVIHMDIPLSPACSYFFHNNRISEFFTNVYIKISVANFIYKS
jgi:hypothetical protein